MFLIKIIFTTLGKFQVTFFHLFSIFSLSLTFHITLDSDIFIRVTGVLMLAL